jgi:cell wall-associated NlpC family hydrolase
MANTAHLFSGILQEASRRYGIPVGVLERQMMAESGGNPHARSPVGALGLMQLMPQTARGLGVTDPFDPQQNIMGGAHYLAEQMHRYGSLKLALAAYNAGPAAVAKYGGVPPFAETQKYVRDILGEGLPDAGAAPQVSPTAARSSAGLGGGAPALPPGIMKANELATQTIPNLGTEDLLNKLGGTAGHIASMEIGEGDPLSYVPKLAAMHHQIAPKYSVQLQLGGGSHIVQAAKGYLGTPYKWGGTSRQSGMDCSAFTQAAMRDAGIKIGRTTYEQVKEGMPVSVRHLQPGDLVFTEPGHAGPNHVGLYVGHGMIQQSPHTGTVNSYIALKDFLGGGFVAARRYMQQPKGGKRGR